MPSVDRFNPLFVKLVLIAAITVLLLIPLHLVESLIAERSMLRGAAVERIANVMGHAQSVGGLMLVVPVIRTQMDGNKLVTCTKTIHILSTSTKISGSIATQTRRSGIYTVPTYQALLHIQGSISNDALLKEMMNEPGITKQIGPPKLFLAVSDPAGIRSLAGFRVNDVVLPISPAAEPLIQGVWADLPALDSSVPQTIVYSADLGLSGTERLHVLPLAETTTAALDSTWPNPSFSGSFAPAAPHVDDHGFAAVWSVLQLNRNYPQSWNGNAVSPEQIQASGFGVDFYQPVDTYQRDYRAIHYAILFIALTFMGLFLLEHTVAPRVHAVQYGMIGAALSVFYLVLVAVSEHLAFAASYALAAAGLSLLLSVYFSGMMRSAKAGVLTGTIAGISYVLLYLLVLSEQYALLFGALAIFMIVAAIMIATRRLDWYRLADGRQRPS